MQRRYRLKSNGAFRYIYKRGKVVRGKLFSLYYAKSQKGLKIGFSVSKRVGNSVMRNKIKRHLRENFRLLLGEVDSSYSYIFVAKEPAAKAGHYEIGEEMKILLSKVKQEMK